MRNTILIFAAGLTLSLTTAAFAADVQQPMAQPVSVTTTATAADSDRLICHQFVHQGMLLKSNVCKTQKQWDDQRRHEEYDFADFQNRTYTHPIEK
jgi:hypothetical protein